MFDPKSLLDQFLGGQANPAGNQPGASPGGQGVQGGRGIGDFLRGAGGGAVAGSLAALLLGSKAGREIGGEALKLGGMAAVGALAYKAYNDWQAGKQAPVPQEAARQAPPLMLPPPSGTPFNPSTESGQQSPTKADGHVDAQEQARIFAEMDKLALSSEDKAFVMDELRANLDVDAVARGATSPEQAAEIYAASLLAVTVDSAAERGYLAMLAARLKLDDALVAHLHGTVAAATGEKVPVAP